MNISAGSRSFPVTNYAQQQVAPSPKPERRPDDPLWNEAGDLLAARGVADNEHTLMQENLATYLSHRTKGALNDRWQGKLDRELATPYTNAEVLQHLDELEDSLQANLLELPAMPSKLFITGSFSKGRLGANSDLDGYAVLSDDQVSAGFDAYERREKNPLGSNLFPLSENNGWYNNAHLMMGGKSVQVKPEQVMQDGFLRKAYAQVQENRSSRRRETHPLYEKVTGMVWGEDKDAKDKRDAFDSPSIGNRIQSMVLSIAGALSVTPIIGSAVHMVADYFVAQNHLDLTKE
jgi:hypothetical protein